MEPEERHKEDQADSAGNEGLNQETTVEKNNKGAAELEGQDQDIVGDMGELNQGRVDMSEVREAVLGEDGNYTEDMTEPDPEKVKTVRKSSLGELKSNAEEEESEELGGADKKDTGVVVSPSAGEEEKTPRGRVQWKIKEHEEEGLVEESRFFLEKDEKVVLANQDQRKKEVHADTEEKEKNTEETADREGMALEKAQVLALDQKDLKGGTEAEVVETTEIQKDNDLSRLGQGSNLEITKEGKEVAADATPIYQRETEESAGLGMEQNKVYTKAGDEEIAGIDQRERESLIAQETETSVETQGKPEEVLEAGEMTVVRDATVAEEEARLLEANQIQVEEAGEAPETEVDRVEAEIGTEKKDAATTLHQGETEKLVEGRQGESREPVGEQQVSEMVMGGEDIPLAEIGQEKIGKVTTEEVVMIPVEDNIEDLVETSEVVRGEKDLAAMEAEREAVDKVTTEDDVSLAVAKVKVENLMDINEIQMGEEDMALNVEAKEETAEKLIADEDVGGEVTEAPESISRIQEEMPLIVIEEIPEQTQDSRSKEKMESEVIEEEVGNLTQPEQRLEEQVEEKEEEQLASAGMIDKVETGELEMALAINQNEMMKGLRPSQEKAEIAVVDAVGEKLPSQEKILSWSPELEGRIQEIAGMSSREGISRLYKQEDKLSQELVAELVRIGQERRDLGLSQIALLETSIRLTEELGKLASEEESHQVKGKIILGLAGLRQGPIQVTPRRTIQSAGGYNGVLAHVAPGLIVTGLRKPGEKRLTKQDHTELGKRRLEQRETRSAEQGRFGISMRSNEAMVFMGYRIGRERMYCLSEAEKRMVKIQQLEEIKKKPAVEQVKVPRQEQEEELPETWLGRPWTQHYVAAQASSGWTAGTGPGHGRISRSLRAGIKERINLMVMGECATKSAAQKLEPLNVGMRRRMFELRSKSANVHWLNEILRPRPPGSRFSVADQKVHDEGSPGLMTERQSPGLFTRKKELKDWRDGVMGIAIRRYNAMRLAMWGEGPVGLHIKGRKLAEDSYVPTSSSHKVRSILGHVERRVLTMAQQVTNERVPGLEVGGQSLVEALKQDMELARSKKGLRFSRSSLPLESETLEVQSEKQVEFSAQTANSESGSPERRLGCQGTQELDGSSQWLADQNEAGSQHALEQDASTTTSAETIGTRGKEQERIKMQTSPPQQHHMLHAQATSDKMTGSNPVSPASSGSPSSSGSISPSHLTHDSSLDSHLSFDGPKSQNRALVSSGMYISPDPASMWDKTHAEIAEQAKHEAEIENRIAEMKKEGFWSLKRLSKVPEPIRPKVHWDYLCEEMQWLSADFAQERRWKRGVARKVVRMVIRHHEEQKQKEERAKREEQAKLRRIASSIAKEVKQFWSNVEKVVQFKQQSRLEEKRKKALDLQLDFIVGQTEKYSDLLTQSLNETLPVPSKTSGSRAGSTASSPPPPAQLIEDDGDFQPHEESDDEETIEAEEQQEGNDSETQLREIELLKQESELPLEELLQTLPSQILENSFSVSPCASSSDNDDEEEGDSEEEVEQEESQTSETLKEKPKPVTQRNKKPWKPDEEDEEFTANEEEAEDVEETIDAEEKLEGNVDHSKELDDLAKEGELPMEELLQKYAGAYASDFEVEASDTSSEALEPSTSEYEEESEEENSTSHSDSTEEIEESEQEESEVEDALEEERRDASVIQEEDFGVEYLLKQDDDNGGEGDNDSAPAPGPKKEITDIAAAAESLQPKGYTLATTQVKTPIPYLLRGTLREYQHIGLDWLVTMYEKKLNGILADEMGLGKTIQTISLLAHLACEKGSWGPHLIIVPTSVMLNWEMEIKRWCPSFKILTYYGAQKERKLKRQGWTKPNAFHICITSYKLVLQDHQAFRRKNWKYLILDEAQNIKNFKSQRWQSLLNFNSQRRLLLTGTPLQNSLMELWSLMHFLMPHVFQSHREFKEWFSNPLTGMIEGSQEYNENLVKRLHKVLRPFLLRRVKVDVEKQMPKKYEHVIKCRLSKRQRYLYDDFMAQATTKETLATGHFMSVINILMQLRKVCNHPNLFDPRPIHSPFITEGICFRTASLVLHALGCDPLKNVDLGIFDLINLEGSVSRYETDTFLPKWKVTRKMIEEIAESPDPPPRPKPVKMKVNRMLQPMPKPENRTVVLVNSPRPTAPLQRPITPVLPESLTPALAPGPHPGPGLPGPLPPTPLPVSLSLPVPIPMPPSSVTMSVPVPPPARPQTPTLVPTLSQNNPAAALLQSQASVPQVLPMAMTAAQLAPNTPRPLLSPPPVSPTTTSSLKAAPVPLPMGQQPPVSSLSATTVRQKAPTNTLSITSVQQQPPISTLGISPMAQQPPTNTQSINTLSISPLNTLGVPPVGGQQPPPTNPLGPGPAAAAAQQSTSAVGMVKPMNIHSAVPTLPGYNFAAAAGGVQQRLLLSPDMQARLPSGEVVSIGQLASLANRPLQGAPGSKPLTFQIQGNKLTLTGTQVRQVTMPQPARQLPRNVVHLVSPGGQHHIISQPAQVALIQAMAQQAGQNPVGVQNVPGHQPPTILPVPATSTTVPPVASTATISVPIAVTQVPSSAVNSSGVVKIVVRQAPRDGLVSPAPGPQHPPMRPVTPTTASTLPGLPTALLAQRAPLPVNPVSSIRLPNQPLVPVRPPAPAPLQTLVRPMLRMIQASNPNLEQQLVPPSPPPTVASFAISPAATVTVSANTSPTMVSQIASSPMPKEEPEMLTLRSTTPTPPPPLSILAPRPRRQPPPPPRSPFFLEALEDKRKKQKEERLDRLFRLNEQHCNLVPIYGTEVLRFCSLFPPAPPPPQEKEEEKEEVMAEASDERARATQKVEPKGSRGSGYTHCYAAQVQRSAQHLEAYWQRSEALAQAILTPKQRIEELTDIIERFIFVMPPVEAPAITMHTSHPPPTLLLQQSVFKETLRQELSPHASCLHRIICNMRTQFPDLRLIQYDCGKLQTLDILLRQLKAGSHRVLIFTQMTRMLDVLEQFLNYHGHIYLRLDGSTRVEQRQALMERFNADKRIFCFILSTRSGGVGVNLTGADTVVFYDSDWNPTMDAQAQDRCHRIGQTRDVHIYRLISERTVEENILKKANQKRMLGDMAIEGGNFTTAYFKQQTIRELFDMPLDEPTKKEGEIPVPVQEEEEDPMATKQTQILEQALCKAEDPEDIRAATQAKAEQVAELAEFNENIPLDAEDRSSKEEEEEISKAEQEIASLVEQLTPIERYAMNFLEASLEDISREELKQAEEQVEAARKDIDQAKDEVVFKLPEDEDESYLLEEGSSKKSKKARFPSRIGSERTGTRMSERLRSTRLPPKDGDGRDVESSQSRLPNLRHSRMVTDEDDNLPQVAQHTRSASVRRELVREEKRAQIVPNTRRTLTRREELWNKGPSSGEKVQKMPPHRSEASGDRFLRANLHRTDTPSAGDKWLQATPQKSDPGVAGDRILRGTTSKTETLVVDERLPGSVPQASDTNLDKGPRLGLQKPEKTSGPDKLTCSSPKSEGSRTEVKAPEFHLQGLDGEAFKLKADVEEQKTEEISQLGPPILDFHPVESAADKEVPAFQEQDTQVTGKSLGTQTLPDAGKLNIPGSKMKATTPVPLGTVKLTSESKSEATGEINLPVIEPKMSAQKPTEEADVSTSYHAAEGESVNSADEATRQISTRETTAPDDTAKVVSEPLSSKSTKDTTWETAGSAASFMLDSEVPKMDTPVFTSLDHSPATSSLLQLETLTCIKEQNGLKESLRSGDLPSRISSLLTEPQLEILPLGATSPISQPADYKVNSLDETTTQNQGAVGKNNQGEGPQETRLAAVCPGSASSQESSSLQGNLSSDDSLSPNKPPRRRTSADVQIQKSCQTPDGPAAKVLRKLPGRLVTVVEEKELIRRRRNRMCKLDSTPSAVINLGSGLAQSLSEPEIPPSTKALPLLRDLPARRRIELESRAAAKEKDDGSKGEPLGNTSSEPVKRKRGRPPKNKSPDQKSPGLLQPFPEPALEISPQRKAPVRKTPEGQAGTQSPEQKVPESSTPKSESPKSKTDSSENGDSPVEKRRRGRPPKTRQSPVMPPKSPASEVLLSPSTKPQTVELPTKVKKKPQRSPEAVSVTEGPSKLHEPLDLHPKTAVSKTSPKARNRTSLHSQPGSDSNSSLKGRELLTVSTKALSKPSTDVCEPRASSPRGASATEASPEMQDPPYLSPVSRSLPKGAPSSPATNSPPKRKRGRPPKNPSSPRVVVAQPPASNSDQETSLEKHTPAPPGRKRRRRRRKDELGPSLPSANQSSSDGEDTRPLTRLALLKREEKPESCSGALVQPSPKHKGTERASSAESSTWEQPSSDTPARSTRLRPGCLVPPLERETQRRKRRCSVEGKRVRNSSKSPASRGISEQEGGESESSLKSSSESNSYKCTQQPKRQCYDSARGHGRKRGQGHQSGMADRILRSAVKPADSTRSGSSPIPPRKTGPAFASSAAGVTGALSSPTTPSSTAPVTSSQSNRGRKPKT